MKRRALPVFSVLAVLFLVNGCSGGATGTPSGDPAGHSLTQAQRFTLKDENNVAVSLDQVLAKHKAVLIDFWATWCGYCIEEMPDLIRLQKKNEAGGFTVLGVNAGESSQQVSSFKEKMKLNFPVVLDEEMGILQAYGIVGIPTSILVDPSGKVLGTYHEFSPQLEADVEKALK